MGVGDFFSRLGGRDEEPERLRPAGPPTSEELLAALDRTQQLVDADAVPSCVTARVERVIRVLREAIPRLEAMGSGSPQAYSVMATATDYLPEGVGGYLRLPRRFADTRPVDGGRSSLMVLVDQLDLLGRTMDQVLEAVLRDDANALVVHGRFLEEKFGHHGQGGELHLPAASPPSPEDAAPGQEAEAPAPAPLAPPSATDIDPRDGSPA